MSENIWSSLFEAKELLACSGQTSALSASCKAWTTSTQKNDSEPNTNGTEAEKFQFTGRSDQGPQKDEQPRQAAMILATLAPKLLAPKQMLGISAGARLVSARRGRK